MTNDRQPMVDDQSYRVRPRPSPLPGGRGRVEGGLLEARGRGKHHRVLRLTSNIERRTSNVEHRTSNVEHRTSNVEHRTLNCRTLRSGRSRRPRRHPSTFSVSPCTSGFDVRRSPDVAVDRPRQETHARRSSFPARPFAGLPSFGVMGDMRHCPSCGKGFPQEWVREGILAPAPHFEEVRGSLPLPSPLSLLSSLFPERSGALGAWRASGDSVSVRPLQHQQWHRDTAIVPVCALAKRYMIVQLPRSAPNGRVAI